MQTSSLAANATEVSRSVLENRIHSSFTFVLMSRTDAVRSDILPLRGRSSGLHRCSMLTSLRRNGAGNAPEKRVPLRRRVPYITTDSYDSRGRERSLFYKPNQFSHGSGESNYACIRYIVLFLLPVLFVFHRGDFSSRHPNSKRLKDSRSTKSPIESRQN